MDEKMMQMLTQLIEGQNETNKQISELTNRVGGLESKFGGLESKFGGLESKVDRTTLLLEDTQGQVKIIGEGLVAFHEQVDRQFEEVHVALDEKTDLLATVIKVHSSDVNKLKEESRHMQRILGEHEVAIRILNNQTQ